MKWTTLIGSGIVTLMMVSQMAWAEDGHVLTQSLEQSQQRLEQRWQNRNHEGSGMQYRYEERSRYRNGGGKSKQNRYEEQAQSGSFGGGGRR